MPEVIVTGNAAPRHLARCQSGDRQQNCLSWSFWPAPGLDLAGGWRRAGRTITLPPQAGIIRLLAGCTVTPSHG
jgi:hypothetical protein